MLYQLSLLFSTKWDNMVICCGMISRSMGQGTVLTFAGKDWEKLQKMLGRIGGILVLAAWHKSCGHPSDNVCVCVRAHTAKIVYFYHLSHVKILITCHEESWHQKSLDLKQKTISFCFCSETLHMFFSLFCSYPTWIQVIQSNNSHNVQITWISI